MNNQEQQNDTGEYEYYPDMSDCEEFDECPSCGWRVMYPPSGDWHTCHNCGDTFAWWNRDISYDC